MTESDSAFWENGEYERAQGPGRVPRLDSQIRRCAGIRRCWDGTWDGARMRRVRFAEAAWSAATEPAAPPAYVSRHARVASGRVRFNSQDSTLTGVVELVMPWPPRLARDRTWQRGGQWASWPTEVRSGATRYREPEENEIVRNRYLLNLGTLIFPLSLAWLPAAPSGPDQDLSVAAREAVSVIIGAMNTMVAPVIGVLEESRGPGQER